MWKTHSCWPKTGATYGGYLQTYQPTRTTWLAEYSLTSPMNQGGCVALHGCSVMNVAPAEVHTADTDTSCSHAADSAARDALGTNPNFVMLAHGVAQLRQQTVSLDSLTAQLSEREAHRPILPRALSRC
eukprot:GHUV01052228.1.p1 GENE.GHUV01052228.1~~GHUV01052228.1.p1  ORF type:complete len:129 (-),score=15.04 GHUV01052228.1:104-490(-)